MSYRAVLDAQELEAPWLELVRRIRAVDMRDYLIELAAEKGLHVRRDRLGALAFWLADRAEGIQFSVAAQTSTDYRKILRELGPPDPNRPKMTRAIPGSSNWANQAA